MIQRTGSSNAVGDNRERVFEAGSDPLPIEPISVRVAMAVRLTGISRSRIYELIQAGDLEIVKIGSSTFILFESLKRLMAH